MNQAKEIDHAFGYICSTFKQNCSTFKRDLWIGVTPATYGQDGEVYLDDKKLILSALGQEQSEQDNLVRQRYF